jgi:hypothetical protein
MAIVCYRLHKLQSNTIKVSFQIETTVVKKTEHATIPFRLVWSKCRIDEGGQQQ